MVHSFSALRLSRDVDGRIHVPTDLVHEGPATVEVEARRHVLVDALLLEVLEREQREARRRLALLPAADQHVVRETHEGFEPEPGLGKCLRLLVRLVHPSNRQQLLQEGLPLDAPRVVPDQNPIIVRPHDHPARAVLDGIVHHFQERPRGRIRVKILAGLQNVPPRRRLRQPRFGRHHTRSHECTP